MVGGWQRDDTETRLTSLVSQAKACDRGTFLHLPRDSPANPAPWITIRITIRVYVQSVFA